LTHKPNALSGSSHFAEVGEGALDWAAIFRLAGANRISNLYVEQDQTDRPPLESLQISYTNLAKLLAA
jgi:sugar phosphate isomerase/epimerase